MISSQIQSLNKIADSGERTPFVETLYLLLITCAIQISITYRVIHGNVLIRSGGNISIHFITFDKTQSVFSIVAKVQGVQLKSLVGVACYSTHVINTENDLIFSKLIK